MPNREQEENVVENPPIEVVPCEKEECINYQTYTVFYNPDPSGMICVYGSDSQIHGCLFCSNFKGANLYWPGD